MRRQEKAIGTREELSAIIRESQVIRLAMSDGGSPYMVPLNFGYDGECIYFHCAAEGTKVEILQRNSKVCFEFEKDVEIRTHATLPCNWSCSFQSVIGFGQAVELKTRDEKSRGLELIMAQYSVKDWDFTDIPLDRLKVWAIQIDSISGKQSFAPEQKA